MTDEGFFQEFGFTREEAETSLKIRRMESSKRWEDTEKLIREGDPGTGPVEYRFLAKERAQRNKEIIDEVNNDPHRHQTTT